METIWSNETLSDGQQKIDKKAASGAMHGASMRVEGYPLEDASPGTLVIDICL